MGAFRILTASPKMKKGKHTLLNQLKRVSREYKQFKSLENTMPEKQSTLRVRPTGRPTFQRTRSMTLQQQEAGPQLPELATPISSIGSMTIGNSPSASLKTPGMLTQMRSFSFGQNEPP